MSTHETTRRPAKRKRRPNYRPVIFLALVCAAIFAAGYCVGVRAADKAAPTLQEPVQESTSTPEPTNEPSEVLSMEEVLWRDDIVTDGNLLDYDLQVTMQACCEEYGVPYALALAVADVESRFDPDATSNTNDYGLMQINTGRNLCAQSVKRLLTGENQTATVPPLSGRPKRPRSLPRWGKWLCKWQRLCGLNNGCTGPKGRVFGCDLFILCYLPEHEQHQQRHLPEHQWQCQQQQLHQHQRVPPRSDGKARPSRPKAKSSAIHHIKGGHIQP